MNPSDTQSIKVGIVIVKSSSCQLIQLRLGKGIIAKEC